MTEPLLLKRKTKKSPKRLGRPQKNKKLDIEHVFNLLHFLKKALKGQKNPQTKRRLDNSPQKSHVLSKPMKKIIDPKPNEADLYKKFHRLAEGVLSDDEDLLENCHRLAEKFAKLKVNKVSQPKTEDDCVLLEIPNISSNVDEKFLKACQRSAQKIAKILKDSHHKPNPSTKTIHTDLTNMLEIDPKSSEDKPEKTSKVGMAKSNLSAKMTCIDLANDKKILKPAEKETEKLEKAPEDELEENKDKIERPLPRLEDIEEGEIIDENSNKIANSKPSAKLEVVPKPPENKPKIASKIVVPKSNPSAKITCIDLTDDKIVPKPAENKTEKIIPKTAVQGKKNSVSIKDFRFSTAEKKKVGEYHSNTFNATGKSYVTWQTMPNRRYIIIDGSNVAFAHGNGNWFSSKGIQYCLKYFETMGHKAKAVVPLFRRNAFQSTHPRIIDELHKEGKIVFTPCKNIPGQKSISYDDRFILGLAYELDAAVVSNDNYRDLIDESPAFRWIVQNRVVGYSWCDDIFMLPKDPYGRRRPSLDEILQC